MTFTPRGAAITVAIAMLAAVATQLFYVGVVSPADDALLRKINWVSEMALYSLIAAGALSLMARGTMPLVWSAIAIAGLVNVVQVGVGLSQFGPAGEASDPKVFESVLGGAFFLYFHGKAMIGMAAIGAGLAAWADGTHLAKAFGAGCILSGLAAAVLNLLGMANGMALVFAAGAAGTAATAFLALTVLLTRRES